MNEPEVALAFSADVWVEELHRHLSDHGGARVRSVVVDAPGALDESYDVLVAGHRWAPLTRALVDDVRARGRSVLGVYDREERASRIYLSGLGVDALVEADGGPDAFVRAITRVARDREHRDGTATTVAEVPRRRGHLVTVGGAPGSGRSEIAIALARELSSRRATVLLDADDVAPAVALRLGLAIEPNLRTAIDAAEHGLGDFDACVQREPHSRLSVVVGVPNPAAWSQVRPGEVVRVVDRLPPAGGVVVADGAGSLEDVGAHTSRSRYATARALVGEADVLVAVTDASPGGVVRLLSWIVDARELAPATPLVVALNRAPAAAFRRRELAAEITDSAPVHDVVFVEHDPAVVGACWDGRPVTRGRFVRDVRVLAAVVEELA